MRHGALPLVLLLSACAASVPEGYPVSQQVAFDRLVESELSGLIARRSCGVELSVDTDAQPANSKIVWRVRSGEKMLMLTALLTPVGADRTEIVTSAWNEEDGDNAYNGTKLYPRPLVNQPVLPNLDEQIAALMEARPYDIYKVKGGVRNDGACIMQKEGRKRGTKFAVDDVPGHDSRSSASMRRYADSLRTMPKPGAPDPRAGKPMVDPRQR